MDTTLPGKKVGSFDMVLLILTLVLTTLGILLVYDASYSFALQHSISLTKYVGQQALYAGVGVGGMLAASRIGFWTWRKFATIGLLIAGILLGLVLVHHIGHGAKGAHRWIKLGPANLQPSEFVKFFLILFIARSCAGSTKIMRRFLTGPGPSIAATVILALLTAKEPDLGTAILIVATGLATLLFAGMKLRHFAVVLLCTVLAVSVVFYIKNVHSGSSYQIQRVLVFLHPEEDKLGDGFQVYHSLLAIGTGGLTGDGLGQGREKLDLPEAHTDFIFSVIGEEGGLFSSLFVLALYGLIVMRGMNIACACNDRFGALVAAGISFAIGFQAFVNIAVVTSTIPATGVPLPGISYGGSSLFVTLLMIGVLLNIGKYPNGNPALVSDSAVTKSERDFERRWPSVPSGEEETYRSSRKPKRTATRTAY